MSAKAMPMKRLILPAEKLRFIRSCFDHCPHFSCGDCGNLDRCRFRSRGGRILSQRMRSLIPSWCPLPDAEDKP
jgi:hypothetical protein